MSTVGILVRPDLGKAGPAVRDLVAWLQERNVGACLDERTAALVEVADRVACRVASSREVAATADVLVVLGGDGTLLAASHLVDRPVPVLGGDYRFEERRMLRARVQQRDAPDTTGDVLNDVVVTKAALSRIIELDVAVDGLFVSAFRADGLIVSSPTGSTAYNLAAGGPILHPTLDAVVLTPICPHMLTNRPLVVSDRSSIEVRLRTGRESDAHLTLDGQRGFPLRGGDVVTVTRSPRTIRLVKAQRDYFEVLRTKLKWGESETR